jgi:hypothetical protein
MSPHIPEVKIQILHFRFSQLLSILKTIFGLINIVFHFSLFAKKKKAVVCLQDVISSTEIFIDLNAGDKI